MVETKKEEGKIAEEGDHGVVRASADTKGRVQLPMYFRENMSIIDGAELLLKVDVIKRYEKK